MLAWLLDSYERAMIEDRHSSSKRGSIGGRDKKVLLALCKECAVTHVALLLSELELFDPSYTPTKNVLVDINKYHITRKSQAEKLFAR